VFVEINGDNLPQVLGRGLIGAFGNVSISNNVWQFQFSEENDSYAETLTIGMNSIATGKAIVLTESIETRTVIA
jgi:hypothetical protein